VGAAGHGFAKVVRARVGVVAVGSSDSDARAADALVGERARIQILARVGVVRVLAPDKRVARVLGTGVVVVAVEQGAGAAFASDAGVPEGAEVAVVAG